MRKVLLAGVFMVGGVSLSNAQELVDPCGSPKEVYSKYVLDKCYKVYFDAITDAKRKAGEALSKANKLESAVNDHVNKINKLESMVNDHERRLRALEVRPAPTPAPAPDIGRWELEEIGSIHFDFDKFNIREDQVTKLDEIAKRAKESGHEVLVVGFADRIGTSKYNFNLSMWRAQNTASELVKRGVDMGRIRTTAYGKELYKLIDPQNRANQRVVKVYIVK